MSRMVMAVWAALVLGGMSSATQAQEDWPDLTGDWSGESEAVVIGDTLHHEAGDMPHLSSVMFTLAIEGQDGRRFWGTISSGEDSEPLIGVIRNDRRTIHFTDSDGYGFLELVAEDVIEHCYVHANPGSQVASCITLARQP